MSARWCAVVALLAGACGPGVAPSDGGGDAAGDAAGGDAAAGDAAAGDVRADDVQAGDVQAGDVRAGDGGELACAMVEEPEPLRDPFARCDAREQGYCAVWMAMFAPGQPLRVTCVRGAGCARASECADPSDQTSCRCGEGPACARYAVCAGGPGESPRCRCVGELLATPRPDAG